MRKILYKEEDVMSFLMLSSVQTRELATFTFVTALTHTHTDTERERGGRGGEWSLMTTKAGSFFPTTKSLICFGFWNRELALEV